MRGQHALEGFTGLRIGHRHAPPAAADPWPAGARLRRGSRRRGVRSRRRASRAAGASSGRDGIEAKLPARAGAIGFERHLVGERMADEARIDTMAGVDRWLHREQAQHAVGAAADLLGALLAPRPHRRADVVHGAQTALAQPFLHAEVEVGRVDADEHVRLPGQQALAELAPQAQQARQVTQHLCQSHHRQLRGVMPGIESGRAHLLAADAGEFGVGVALVQFVDQAGAEQVAGGFAGAQGDAGAGGLRWLGIGIRQSRLAWMGSAAGP